VYFSCVVQVRHIIKDDRNLVCSVSKYKIYHDQVQGKYLNGLHTNKNIYILSTRKLIDAHAYEINMI